MFPTNHNNIKAELVMMGYDPSQLVDIPKIASVLEPLVEASLISRRDQLLNKPGDIAFQVVSQFASNCLSAPHKDIATAVMANAIASLMVASSNVEAKAEVARRAGITSKELSDKITTLAIECGIASEAFKYVVDVRMKNPLQAQLLDPIANSYRAKYAMLVSLFKAVPNQALTNEHCNALNIKQLARDVNEECANIQKRNEAVSAAIADANTRAGHKPGPVTVKKRPWYPNGRRRHPEVATYGQKVIFELTEDGIIRQKFEPIEKREEDVEIKNHGIDLEATAEREQNDRDNAARQIEAERAAAASANANAVNSGPAPVATQTFEIVDLDGGYAALSNELESLASDAATRNRDGEFRENEVSITELVPPGHETVSHKVSVILEPGTILHALSVAATRDDHALFGDIVDTAQKCKTLKDLYDVGARISRLSARPVVRVAAEKFVELIDTACTRYMRHQLSDSRLNSFNFLTDTYAELAEIKMDMFHQEWLATLGLLEEVLPQVILSVGSPVKFPDGLEHSVITLAQPVVNAGVGCTFKALDFEYPSGFNCGALLQERHAGAVALFSDLITRICGGALYVRVMGVDGMEYAIAQSPVSYKPLVYVHE
ncbi:MAG: hypothetical protein ACKO0Z_10090 [Betaproteobacteria bacterium]